MDFDGDRAIDLRDVISRLRHLVGMDGGLESQTGKKVTLPEGKSARRIGVRGHGLSQRGWPTGKKGGRTEGLCRNGALFGER
jgi:hypothetical protein